MNFRSGSRDDPEINLIPFIDVLLVILIFLMLSTTYSKYTELQLRLPTADTQAQQDRPREILVGVSSSGDFSVNRAAVNGRGHAALVSALRAAAASAGKDPALVIGADAGARHQAVISVMEAAQQVGLVRITFAAQSSTAAAK